MDSFILNPVDFQQFNGFYSRTQCREVVYRLYNKTCQGCRTDLVNRTDYVSGHILAARHAHLFEQLFPGLDVDNLLNLHLLCQPCNTRQSAYHFDSPFFLNQVFKESARAIALRYRRVEAELAFESSEREAPDWLERAEEDHLLLQKELQAVKGPFFVPNPNLEDKLEWLVARVLRDGRGRLWKKCAKIRDTVWSVRYRSGVLTGITLLSEVPYSGQSEENLITWVESTKPQHDVWLKTQVVALLRAIEAGLRAHRKAWRGRTALAWEDTPQSLTEARLYSLGLLVWERGGSELIKNYEASFQEVSLGRLAAQESGSWIGWPKSEVAGALKNLGLDLGGYSADIAYSLLVDAMEAQRIRGELRYLRVFCSTKGRTRREYLPRPKEMGIWLDVQDIADNGGVLRIAHLDSPQLARIQVVGELLRFAFESSIDGTGQAWVGADSRWEALIERFNKHSKLAALEPFAALSKKQSDSRQWVALNVEALERLVEKLPRFLLSVCGTHVQNQTIFSSLPLGVRKKLALPGSHPEQFDWD